MTWGLPCLVEQDVGRLQVAVEDAALVGVVHGLGHDGHQPGRGGEIGGESRPASCPGWTPSISFMLKKRRPAVLADLVDRHDVRDGRAARRPRPRSGTGQLGGGGELGRPDHLEGHQPVRVRSGGPCRRRPCRPGPARRGSRSPRDASWPEAGRDGLARPTGLSWRSPSNSAAAWRHRRRRRSTVSSSGDGGS